MIFFMSSPKRIFIRFRFLGIIFYKEICPWSAHNRALARGRHYASVLFVVSMSRHGRLYETPFKNLES